METLSDLALATQVARYGQKQAFNLLVRRYQSPVRRFLLNLTLGNESLSDDLAQDTFIKAYTHIGQFQGKSSFQTWLIRIAYNIFYDYQRANRTKHFVPDSETPNNYGQKNSDYGLKSDIYHALSLLKEEERTCITLQLIDGEPIDHISEITGLPTNTVKSHLKRGKEKLTTYLKRNGYDG